MKRLTTEEFIKNAKLVHGDKCDYSLVNYINSNTKIIIICPEHGEFEQTPINHLNNSNCKECNKLFKLKKDENEFIKKAIDIHGDLYDYSEMIYTSKQSDVIIINKKYSTKHLIRADSHIKQKARCSLVNAVNKTKFLIKEFNNIHEDKYDYSKVEYIDAKKNVEIICKINNHGSFFQTPDNHKQGKGCNICVESTGERSVRKWLIIKSIKFNQQEKFKDCKDKTTLTFDFYLPEHNICIEFNGIQHYEPVDFFGGVNNLKSQIKRDKIKIKYCKENNINLLIIKYDQNIEDVLNNYFFG